MNKAVIQTIVSLITIATAVLGAFIFLQGQFVNTEDFEGYKKLNKSSKIKQLNIVNYPIGTIVAWSPKFAKGQLSPKGWKIADGTDNTPDLRDRFLIGKTRGDSDEAGHYNTGHSVGHNGGLYANYDVPFYSVVYIIRTE